MADDTATTGDVPTAESLTEKHEAHDGVSLTDIIDEIEREAFQRSLARRTARWPLMKLLDRLRE